MSGPETSDFGNFMIEHKIKLTEKLKLDLAWLFKLILFVYSGIIRVQIDIASIYENDCFKIKFLCGVQNFE